VNRHPLDLIALLFGLAFCVTGTAFLVNELTDRSFDPAWVAAIGLVALGAVALIATVTRPRRVNDAEMPSEGAGPSMTAAETEPPTREYS
jgi:hypothetical protein